MRTRVVQALFVLLLAWLVSCDADSPNRPPHRGDYEIRAVDWPVSLQGDESIFDGVPDQVGDLKRTDAADSDDAINDASGELFKIRYAGSGEDVTLRLANLSEPGMEPRIEFLLLLNGVSDWGKDIRCVEDTYRGSLNADAVEGGVAPDVTEARLPKSEVPWFSCTVSSTPGERGQSRNVAGWFSGELVWLIDGSSAAAVQNTINEVAEIWDDHRS